MTLWTRLSRPRLFVLTLFQSRSCGYIRNGSSPNCLLQSPFVGLFFKSHFLDRYIKFYSSLPQEKFQPDDTNGPLLNEQIKCQYVRLVTDEGHDILPSWQALAMAKKNNLDLVVVDLEGNPPVCKIFDYKKEKYNQKIREKEKNKNKATIRKGECKEVRFSVKTEQKDLKMKANQIKRLIGDGYRVKCVAMPLKRGKKMATAHDGEEEKIGEEMKALFDTLIEDEAITECEPTMKSGQGHLIVRHKKFGPVKKGSSDKAKEKKISSFDETAEAASDQNELATMIHHEVHVPEAKRYGKREIEQDWNSSLPFAPPKVSEEIGVAAESNRYARKAAVGSLEGDQNLYSKEMGGSGFNRYARTPIVNSPERDPAGNIREIRGSEGNRYAPTSIANTSEREQFIRNKEIMRGNQNNRHNRSTSN